MGTRIVSAIVSGVITGIVVYVIGLILAGISNGGALNDLGTFLETWAWVIGILAGAGTLLGLNSRGV